MLCQSDVCKSVLFALARTPSLYQLYELDQVNLWCDMCFQLCVLEQVNLWCGNSQNYSATHDLNNVMMSQLIPCQLIRDWQT